MTVCRRCDAPTVRATVLCEDHYQEAMQEAREEATGPRQRPGRRPLAPKKPSGPPKVPREVRARQLAQAVHKSGHLTREQAAQIAGVKTGALSRILKYATEAGWIVGRPGAAGGGYVPGEVVPE